MDREDIKLCRMLLVDSRLPYQDLASKLGMSVPAVHKRLCNLVEAGVIAAFTAEVDVSALGAATATVAGRSSLFDPSSAVESLGNDGRTWLVLLGGDATLFTFAHLHSAEELEDYSGHVISICKMLDVYQGVHSVRPGAARVMEPGRYKGLTPLELGIVRSLKDDARKRASEVGREIGVTARTVSKRIAAMQEQRKVRFSIKWSPDYGREIVSLVVLDLPDGASIEEGISSLMSSFPDNVVFCSAFAKGRRSIMATVWTESMRDVGRMVQGMSSLLRARKAMPHLIYSSHFFRTWKDDYLETGRL